MPKLNQIPILFIFALFLVLTVGINMKAQLVHLVWMKDSQTKLEKELIAKFGESQSAHIQKGLKQVADFWRAEDGDASAQQERRAGDGRRPGPRRTAEGRLHPPRRDPLCTRSTAGGPHGGVRDGLGQDGPGDPATVRPDA